MLDVQLADAGFFPISWPEAPDQLPGTTYVRPGRRELVRVFLAHNRSEVAIYTGRDLRSTQLVYRGPTADAALLQQLCAPFANSSPQPIEN
ncbi:hypothetical protein F0P96_16465 [Hymenobacter busanensis]|uniref:Uncharacterized protein n=1 Tax=Hymenobacter busanensis TaxID=2607656 RepID=A0A7L4ZSM0_9BACT|nr:hypothetical protein [Hymenobacter busanensis]KAA9327574.1 hypothetical protein F0P96_16465 [Hymenobacter busanensis]QHJ06088.1 hypothetical protein GUY19_01770 [Hymenobacter busanensis]